MKYVINSLLSCRMIFLLLATVFLSGCAGKSTSDSDENEKNSDVQMTVPLRVGVADLQLLLLLPKEAVRILDARDAESYAKGHVPGAVRVDTDAWRSLALQEDGKRLTDKTGWEKLIRELGINKTTGVVVYSDSVKNSARIWWTLKYLGVQHVGILDGGWHAWTTSKGTVELKAASVSTGDFIVDFQKNRLAVMSDLEAADNKWKIVDARTEGEHKEGKIREAVHIEWLELLTDDKHFFKSDKELKAIFTARQLFADQTVVSHCYSGGRAAVDAYALELAGFKNVKNYYCGWSQWEKREENKKPTSPK